MWWLVWDTPEPRSVPGSCRLLAGRHTARLRTCWGSEPSLRSDRFSSVLQVFLRTQNFSGQRAMFPTAAVPGRFLCEEQMSGPCCLGVKNLSPCYRQAEGTCSCRCAWGREGVLGPARVVLGHTEVSWGRKDGAGQCPSPTKRKFGTSLNCLQTLYQKWSCAAPAALYWVCMAKF